METYAAPLLPWGDGTGCAPDSTQHERYEAAYAKWRELYERLDEVELPS